MEIKLPHDSMSNAPNTRKQLGNYVFGKTLGEGSFSKVKLATHKSTGEVVAIKILEKEKIMDVADVERVSRQIHILKLVRHPNIIQLYQIIETPKQLFLIMEYIQNGELFHFIVKNKRVSEDQARRMFHELISGIQYIHRLSIVHRDLKPENLLLDYNNSLKLVDFGLSNTYKKDETLKTPCGSPCYAAPQMIQGKKYSGLGVDIWSSGVILFAMVCGCLPFEDNDTSKLYKKILSGKFTPVSGISETVKDLLGKILNIDPEKRYTIQQIKQHEWMKTCKIPAGSPGIIVGYNRIPADRKIIQQVGKTLGIQSDYVTKCVEANRHNSITTAYYLMLKKHLRTGGVSSCDMSNSNFDPTLIEPCNRTNPSRSKSKNKGYMTQSLQHDKQNNRQTCNKDLTSIGNLDIVIKNTRKVVQMNATSKYSSTRLQQTNRKSLKSTKNSKNNLHHGTEKSYQRGRLKDFGSKQLMSKQLVPKPPFSREPISASSYNSNINKRYREQFNKSLVSRSREKDRLSVASTRCHKPQQKLRVVSNQSTKIGRDRIESVISISRDRNKSSFAAQISREQLNSRKAVNSSSIDYKQHKRGKSSQMKKVHVNESFNGIRNGQTYYRRQRI